MSEEEIYEEAKKRVKAKRDFYGHLTAYIIVNAILVLVWAFPAGRGYPWFLWPLGGWGIAILINFLNVFVFPTKPEKAAVEREADKIRREQS
jgi:hypothetical protein